MTRWLAIYVDKHGKSRAAMITPPAQASGLNLDDASELGLDDYDGAPVTFVEMPGDPNFRPQIVDENPEVPLQFIDL
ncbi:MULTISPECIES: hypothetical protein [unclassified Sphingomonas]|uniref:hypothetical protein n=1 Tax=unclassified Sphingomonas TaxID=196159 RepID=UPI000829D748|nr:MULTISPECIES: hypothetical protein [unclassified Sphingomonas]